MKHGGHLVMSKKRTKPIIDTIPGYTEKQTKYLRGEITDNEVNGQFYRWLLISATKINDKEIMEKAEKRIAQLKDEAAEKNRKQARERMHRLYRGEAPVLKTTKSTKYTDRHKQIIRNEIDPKSVHGTELAAILKIARAIEDYKTEALIDSILSERREDQREALHRRLDKLKTDSDSGNTIKYRKNDTCLVAEELALLNSEIDIDEVTEEDIRHIINICKKTGDNENLRIAEMKLQYKQNPKSVYVTQDVNEALLIIEKSMGIPITRRKDWFKEQIKAP